MHKIPWLTISVFLIAYCLGFNLTYEEWVISGVIMAADAIFVLTQIRACRIMRVRLVCNQEDRVGFSAGPLPHSSKARAVPLQGKGWDLGIPWGYHPHRFPWEGSTAVYGVAASSNLVVRAPNRRLG